MLGAMPLAVFILGSKEHSAANKSCDLPRASSHTSSVPSRSTSYDSGDVNAHLVQMMQPQIVNQLRTARLLRLSLQRLGGVESTGTNTCRSLIDLYDSSMTEELHGRSLVTAFPGLRAEVQPRSRLACVS